MIEALRVKLIGVTRSLVLVFHQNAVRIERWLRLTAGFRRIAVDGARCSLGIFDVSERERQNDSDQRA